MLSVSPQGRDDVRKESLDLLIKRGGISVRR